MSLVAWVRKRQFGSPKLIIPISATTDIQGAREGIDDLITDIAGTVDIPDRERLAEKDFLFAIDEFESKEEEE